MSVDKLKQDKFDEMLGQRLREHTEPVSADFTDRILRRIKEDQQQKILARVVMEERVALAGCVALGIITIIVTAAFPGIAANFTKQVDVFINKISQTIEAVNYEWRFYMAFVGVFGFAVYSLVDLLVSDS